MELDGKKIQISRAIRRMTWEIEKQKFIELWDTRVSPKWITLKDIQTWRVLSKTEDLPTAADPLAGYKIDSSKNDILVDKISLYSGDITKLKIDAIVNATNEALLPGGGVNGVIHRVAGGFLRKECNKLKRCPRGEAKVTGAYKLPAKYVIQTVGPRGENPSLLKKCYDNSLKRAMENNIRTIAFPCISTRTYGYPNEAASHVAAFSVRQFLEQNSDKFDRVIFCVFLDVDKKCYERVLQTYFPL